MQVNMYDSCCSTYPMTRNQAQPPAHLYDRNFNVGNEPTKGFSDIIDPMYNRRFNIIGSKENQQFYQRLQKNYGEMIFESRFFRPDGFDDITSAYKDCLDKDNVVNPRAEEVLNSICLHTKDEKSGIFREQGFEGIHHLFLFARDKEGKLNNKNLDFILYLDKNFKVNDSILGHAELEVMSVLEACRDEKGICTDERVNIFKNLYENNYFDSNSYEHSKLRNIIDSHCSKAKPYFKRIGSQKEEPKTSHIQHYDSPNNGTLKGWTREQFTKLRNMIDGHRSQAKSNYKRIGSQKEEPKTSQVQQSHSYNTDSHNNGIRKGWTREQFVTHIETRLTSQNMRKSFLKDTEIRNLAKLLGITPDKVLNLNIDDYRALCKKFHPDTCKIANGDACFRIINVLFKLK